MNNEEIQKPTKAELVEMLKEMNDNIEKLPPYAMTSPVTNLDLSALLILLHAIHRAES
jgi:hypothetical protein